MLSMNTHDFLSVTSKIVFFLLTFWSIRTGDPVGLGLSMMGFLIMENFIEDLTHTENYK